MGWTGDIVVIKVSIQRTTLFNGRVNKVTTISSNVSQHVYNSMAVTQIKRIDVNIG